MPTAIDWEVLPACLATAFLPGALVVLTFASNKAGIPKVWRVWPASPREWRIYGFHTLESLTIIALFLAAHSIPGCFEAALYTWSIWVIGAVSVWRWDRKLCYRELSWALVLFIAGALLTPVAGARPLDWPGAWWM